MKKIIFFGFAILFLNSCFKKEIVTDENLIDSVKQTEFDSAVAINSDNEIQNNSTTIDSVTAIVDTATNNVMDFATAKSLNTSEAWRKFLSDNPNYTNKKEIEDYIIRSEVNEIVNNKETGEMPEFEKISKGNYKTSSIEVENDTSCDLTLRYSGTEAKMVIIPPNSKSKVSVISGNYNVVASACGYNYAGSESLNGNYSVVYYITTTRY